MVIHYNGFHGKWFHEIFVILLSSVRIYEQLDRHTLNNADLVMTIYTQCKFFPDNLLSVNKIRHSTY